MDTNKATASSVIGSILGMLEAHEEDISKLTFTVQGCGKVGSTVAKELVRLGAAYVKLESAEIADQERKNGLHFREAREAKPRSHLFC